MRLADLRGRRVAVWGTGREGVAAIRAIAPVRPAELFVIQDRETFLAQTWTPELAALAPLFNGESGREALARAEILVRSPSIGQTHPWVRELRARRAAVTGGTALWMADHAGRTIGVTGSKGKSTTSTLISQLLAAVGRPNVLGGNIGIAALDLPEAELYLLELSVYQCADLTDSPRVVGLTSLFPEHLDWSGGEQEYYRDKLNIAAHGPERVVFNAEDPRLAARLTGRGLPLLPAGGPDTFQVLPGADRTPWVYAASEPLFPRAALRALGRHNEANLCVALGVLQAVGVDCLADRDLLHTAVAEFRPLPHRMTPIEDPSGITFVDDSLSTVPQSTVHAIAAHQGRPMTIILGGQDRGVDYQPLREFLERREISATVVGIPDSGPRILAALAGVPTLTAVQADDLVHAVRLARAHTPVGGVVLLSPAAPSYGRFDNYQHRSRVFQQAIRDSQPEPIGPVG
jgi:UDP-N-acetylmuramoylalanine--D-glutamate ligase